MKIGWQRHLKLLLDPTDTSPGILSLCMYVSKLEVIMQCVALSRSTDLNLLSYSTNSSNLTFYLILYSSVAVWHTDPELCSHLRVSLQCRYTGVSVEALVVEVGLVPPPPPVAAPGPLSVELRIANGACSAKGCVEGWSRGRSFTISMFCLAVTMTPNQSFCLSRGGGLPLLLRGHRLSSVKGAPGSCVCWGQNTGQDGPQHCLDSWKMLGNVFSLSSQSSPVGPAD